MISVILKPAFRRATAKNLASLPAPTMATLGLPAVVFRVFILPVIFS
jgi:hypothetical protein